MLQGNKIDLNDGGARVKKLLVLNGSHSDIPLIRAGKERGYYVITSGNNPELIGHKFSDEYVFGDFSDPEGMLKIFKDKHIDAVCSCANDFGAITAAYLSENLGLPGHDSYETARTIHHKDRFKAFSKIHDIHTPIAESFDELDKALSYAKTISYPQIVKPIDLTGGKGVTTVNNMEEYIKAVNKAFDMSRQKRIVVEPFIRGTYHSLSTFLINKKVYTFFSDNEYSYINPFLVTTSAGTATGIDKVRDTLIRDSEKIADILGLSDGVFHIQYVMLDDKPYILEITRRCSGDFYPVPVEYGLGINWSDWIVSSECGLKSEEYLQIPYEKQLLGGRHCIMGNKNGIVKNVAIAESIKGNIYGDFTWWKPGYEIKNYLVDKLGILFLRYSTYEEMIYKSERITDLIRVEYE